MESKYIIGIDEVGRGPIAGPVAVCVFICKPDFFDTLPTSPTGGKLPKLRDSKKLSAKQRDEWFVYLQKCKKEGKCDFQVSYVSSENIDKFGIVKCIQKALETSLSKVVASVHKNFPALPSLRGLRHGENFHKPTSLQNANFDFFSIFLDGGLKAPKEYVNQQTIIKGDELYPVISCASIVAKVSRDRVMKKYALEYPDYGFENHVGYGTKAHYLAIKKNGTTAIHRKTFL